MLDDEEFEIGPMDDAEDLPSMRIGAITERHARQVSKEISEMLTKDAPDEVGTIQEVRRIWQGMMSLSGYSIAMTHWMLKQIEFKWGPEGEKHKLDRLFKQSKELTIKFYQAMTNRDEGFTEIEDE